MFLIFHKNCVLRILYLSVSTETVDILFDKDDYFSRLLIVSSFSSCPISKEENLS